MKTAVMFAIAVGVAAGASAQEKTAFPTPAWSRTKAAVQDRGSAVERGGAVFNNWCSACHGKDVRNAPGTVSLEYKYQGKSPAALEDRRNLTSESVKLFVRKGVATMPFYRKTEINDADLEALAAYLTQAKP